MAVCNAIRHYQRSIERNSGNDERLLYCIEKLYTLQVTVQHLEDTGVGRTVNSLRKFEGEVGAAARALVAKWKTMVAEEDSSGSEAEFQVTSTNRNGSNNKDDKEGDESVAIAEANNSEIDTQDTTSIQQQRKNSNKSMDDKHSSRRKDKEQKDRSLKRKTDHDDHSRSSKIHKKQESSSTQKVASVKKQNISDNNSESCEAETKNKAHKTKDKHKSRSTSRSDSIRFEDSVSHKVKHIGEKDKSDKGTHKPHDKMKRPLDKPSSSSGDSKIDIKKSKSESKRISSKQSSSKDSSSSSREKSLSKAGKSNAEKTNGSTKTEKTTKKKREIGDDDFIDSYSGTSFADALGMIATGKSPKKKVATSNLSSSSPMQSNSKTSSYKSVNSSNSFSSSQGRTTPVLLTQTAKLPPLDIVLPTLPPISTNYRPLPYHANNDDFSKTSLSTQQANAALTFMSKNQRTKVYSGNKGSLTHVPSLYELCIRLLQENIDAVEYTGGVPYDILRPVLERASPEQLFTLEHHNPYLIEDSDPLWEFHCKKKFRGQQRQEMEGWRETYLRCQDEQEAKLKSLTANIKQSQQVKTAPVRKAQWAYLDTVVKPPRNIAKKQAQYGTARTPVVTPAARVAALSGTNSQLAKAGDARLKIPAGARDNAQTSSSFSKPKRAPLMQKTIAFMKGRFKR